MKRMLGLAAVLAMTVSLGGCQPDQQSRLAAACKSGVRTLNGFTQDDGKIAAMCSCMASAAVNKLDRDTIEYMIGFYEGRPDVLAAQDPKSVGYFQKAMSFELNDNHCAKELGVSSVT